MDYSKCNKCGAEMTRTWINKRKQRVGKCRACGKLVSYGKDKEAGQPGSGEPSAQKKEVQTAQPEKPAKPTAPARSGGSAKRAAGKPGAKSQPVRPGEPVREPAKPGVSSGAGLAGILNRKLW